MINYIISLCERLWYMLYHWVTGLWYMISLSLSDRLWEMHTNFLFSSYLAKRMDSRNTTENHLFHTQSYCLEQPLCSCMMNKKKRTFSELHFPACTATLIFERCYQAHHKGIPGVVQEHTLWLMDNECFRNILIIVQSQCICVPSSSKHSENDEDLTAPRVPTTESKVGRTEQDGVLQ